MDNVCKVNSKPEKQMAAMQTKKANSAIMARRALLFQFSLRLISKEEKVIQNHNVVLDSEKRKPIKD